jgi:hypothetical protein
MPQDYFLRLIDQVAIMLARIAGREIAGDKAGAKEELDAQCRETIGLEVPQLQHLSPEELAQLLNTADGVRQGRAIMLAELLMKDAEMHPVDEPRKTVDYLHAFCLIAYAIDSLDVEDQRVYRPKLQALIDRLGSLQSDPCIAAKLKHYESQEKGLTRYLI